RLLARELQDVADGKTKRLMINMPPGSAKSTYSSVLFPAWFLAQRPGLDMIGASNTSTLAENFSRRVMGLVRDNERVLGYSLDRESAENWSTTNRGNYRAVGIGGTIAGTRADGALIDDPTRSREDVEGEGNREKQWQWFTADLRTRLKPDAFIIVIMTRWHPDDLGGRLLERQPGLWRVVSLPAIAGPDDPLCRAEGEWLWTDDTYGYGDELKRVYAEYEAAGAMRDWAALYQQQPVNAEGTLFKVHQIETIEAIPAAGQTVRAWDLAATKALGTRNPDWTVGIKLQRAANGRFIVEDVLRMRGGPDEVEAAIVNTAKQDGVKVRISIPQDPGQAGKQQVAYLTKRLMGFRVESSPETGDKATRAAPVSSQVNVGNFSIVRANWNAAFIDELASFPGGIKDDQVDALSRAFAMLTNKVALSISSNMLDGI
ncbi:MAG: phage terminase large subunit, partial [Betaproteobacteria bacterium]|nr:phage terminase large subunit [Betaproteobacteria bacterium]